MVFIDLAFKVLAIDKGGQIVVGLLQVASIGVFGVIFGTENVDVIVSLAGTELQLKSVGNTFNDK